MIACASGPRAANLPLVEFLSIMFSVPYLVFLFGGGKGGASFAPGQEDPKTRIVD